MQHVLMATFSYKNLLHQTGEPYTSNFNERFGKCMKSMKVCVEH